MGLIILETKTKKKWWHPWRWLIGIVVVIAVAIFAASSYFFRWQWYRGIRILLIIQLKSHEMIHYMSRKCGLSMPKKKNGQ